MTEYGCPNSVLDSGEDLEGDGIFRTYGGVEVAPSFDPTLPLLNYMLLTQNVANMAPRNTNMWTGATMITGKLARRHYKPALITYSGGLFASTKVRRGQSTVPTLLQQHAGSP